MELIITGKMEWAQRSVRAAFQCILRDLATATQSLARFHPSFSGSAQIREKEFVRWRLYPLASQVAAGSLKLLVLTFLATASKPIQAEAAGRGTVHGVLCVGHCSLPAAVRYPISEKELFFIFKKIKYSLAMACKILSSGGKRTHSAEGQAKLFTAKQTLNPEP